MVKVNGMVRFTTLKVNGMIRFIMVTSDASEDRIMYTHKIARAKDYAVLVRQDTCQETHTRLIAHIHVCHGMSMYKC
jgi:hypothetical protein